MISFQDNINRKEEWTALIKLELGSTFLLRRPHLETVDREIISCLKNRMEGMTKSCPDKKCGAVMLCNKANTDYQ